MSSSNPPAEGVRVHWEELPDFVRDAIEERLGAAVVEARTQRGGFSPGLASRVRLADDRRAFVKAVSEASNPDSPEMHRREARVVASLPSGVPVPRLLWSYDQKGWVALGFEDVEGRNPAQPWDDDDLRLVVDALTRLHRMLTPSPISGSGAGEFFAQSLNGWAALAAKPDPRLDPWISKHLSRLSELESRAPEAAAGETLLQFDVRADNTIIAGNDVYFVDWPHARIGAPFVEWIAFAPTVAMQGGPQPEALFAMAEVRGPEDAIDAVLCSWAGFLVRHSLLPAPPGLPTLRPFQAAQGQVAVGWLQRRLGWR